MSRTARAIMVVLIGIIIASLVIAPAALGSTLKVTGTLVVPEGDTAPAPTAVAIVTLIDATNTSDAGNVIGQQRIDGIGDGQITFAVPYDSATVDPKHAYAVFATVVDGESSWQNPTGVPVITGGPTEAVPVPIPPVVASASTITGRMPLPTDPAPTAAAPSAAAVSIAALIKQETGTLVSRQVLPALSGNPPAYTVSFDPALIDPAATYVIVGAVVDGATVWESSAGVPAIVGGVATGQVDVPLVLTTAAIPAPSALPSGAPSVSPSGAPSSTPTEAPSVTPTEAPSATPEPTAEPTASPTPEPTASPTPEPTASPTPEASASPTPSPTATPTASPTASPAPSATIAPPSGVLTGTLDYPESYQLSADAVAVVALVEGKGRATSSPILATEIIDPAGQAPIGFELTYDPADIDPDGVYTLQAGVFDTTEAWVTSKGVPVITNGAQRNVAVTLSYRPDAAKGEVTGSVTAVGITLEPGATAVTVLIDVDTGLSLGVDLTYPDKLPAPFAIPFGVSDLQEGGTYVVQAEVTNGSQAYANAAGVPVITNGSPISGVQVVVSEVAAPAPSATPVASAPPAPEDDSGIGSGNLLLPLIVIGLLVLLGGVLLARSKDDDTTPPGGSAAVAGSAAAAEAAAAAAGEPAAEGDATPPPPTGAPPASPGSDQA